MNYLLQNIQRYAVNPFDSGECLFEKSKDGEYVSYDDVQKIIKELLEKHNEELHSEYTKGYEAGLDAAYIANV